MKEIQSYSKSVNSFYKSPTSDSQVEKVYQMDSELFEIIKNSKYFHDIFKIDDFFELSNAVFLNEGFNNFSFENNHSTKISNIDKYYKKVTYSKDVIKERNYEVLLHELAHSICFYRCGYSGSDAHGEIFVYNLFYLINKYFNIEYSTLYNLADKYGVSYFYDLNDINIEIKEKEYLKISENIYPFKKNDNFKNRSFFKSTFGYNKKENSFMCLFSNGIKFFKFKRDIFQCESILYINPFLKMTKNELSNIILFSPILRKNEFNEISKKGKIYFYHYFNDKIENVDYSYIISDKDKSKVNKILKEQLGKSKIEGFNVLKFNTLEQFTSAKNFYFNQF